MKRNLKPKKIKKSIGQGLVEFTLTLPIFLLLLFGLIEFSRLMFVYIAVTTASREAVRYGSAIGDNGSGTPRYMDCAGIRDAAKVIGQFSNLLDNQIVINYDTVKANHVPIDCSVISEDDIAWGDRVEVVITNWFTFGGTVPFVQLPPVPITSTARRTIMKGAQIVKESEIGVPPAPTNPNLKPIYVDSFPMSTIGNKCYDVRFTWSPNGLWDVTDPVESYFLREIGGDTVEVVPGNPTIFLSDFDILNNSTETFRLYAQFSTETSKTLTFTLHCVNGVLSKLGS